MFCFLICTHVYICTDILCSCVYLHRLMFCFLICTHVCNTQCKPAGARTECTVRAGRGQHCSTHHRRKPARTAYCRKRLQLAQTGIASGAGNSSDKSTTATERPTTADNRLPNTDHTAKGPTNNSTNRLTNKPTNHPASL